MSITRETINTIIGFVLFGISELLPFVDINSNGLFHTLVLGFKSAFDKNLQPSKDIELAKSLVTTKDEYAYLINTIDTNRYIKEILHDLIKNPSTADNIKAVQNSPELAHLISVINFNNLDVTALIKMLQPVQEKI